MSDAIKHECGIAFIRLRKPLEFYRKKYGTSFYAQNKLYLLMEKQHNRGQDGVGVANIKLDVAPGQRYISRYRSVSNKPIQDTFDYINRRFKELEEKEPENIKNPQWLKDNEAFTGEVWLGHLRYGTYGKNSIEACHPFLRQNNWKSRNLVVAGNFNLTNVDELFDFMVSIGQHPKEKADTVTVMEKIGHYLDIENQKLFDKYNSLGYSNEEISHKISEHLDLPNILRRSSTDWDGGYVMCGMVGHGDSFILRDPNGIRPGFWYADDEVIVAASERAAIQTAFNVPYETVQELSPGSALIVDKDGSYGEHQIILPKEKTACSFERIYFSRGGDKDIYRERMQLGRNVAAQVFESINNDFENTVFSYIPNTAEGSYFGLMKAVHDRMNQQKTDRIMALSNKGTPEEIAAVLQQFPRAEKVAIKDAKLRTFITQDDARDDLVAHVYDITYGSVKGKSDTLVMIDDSIVRGTTLKQSILRMLDRLNPKKIIIVSSAPQIRYPDCYGIDMAILHDFIAFRAAIALLKENGKAHIIKDTYDRCIQQNGLPKEQIKNYVQDIYAPFTPEEIAAKCAELLKPIDCKAEVEIIFQSLDGLHKACPDHLGDWYFSGNFPTPGGNRVINKAFINYFEGKNERAY